MIISHIITRFILGGAQENTLFTCDYLTAAGHDVILLTGPPLGAEGSMLERARGRGFRVEVIDSLCRHLSPTNDLASYRALCSRLRSIRPDLVHTHSSKAGFLGRLAARDAGVPHIVHTIHGLPFNRLNKAWANALYIRLEHYAAQLTDRLISVADAMTAQAIAAGVAPPGQFQTIYSGMRVQPYMEADEHRDSMRRKLGFEEDDVVIGTISRLSPGKGHNALIDAMRPLADAPSQLKFLWVGDGPIRTELEDRLTRLDLASRVTLAGLIPTEHVPEYLSAMDVLVHPSFWEGLPRTLPQGLLAGLPVVSFDIDGAHEVVHHGENGFLIRPGDVEHLTWAIETLFRTPGLREKMGRRYREQIAEMFDHEKMGEQIEQVYRKVVRGEYRRPARTRD